MTQPQTGSWWGLVTVLRQSRSEFETYAAILERTGRDELVVEGEGPPPLETQHWSMHSHGAMFCEARVNAVTGEVREKPSVHRFS